MSIRSLHGPVFYAIATENRPTVTSQEETPASYRSILATRKFTPDISDFQNSERLKREDRNLSSVVTLEVTNLTSRQEKAVNSFAKKLGGQVFRPHGENTPFLLSVTDSKNPFSVAKRLKTFSAKLEKINSDLNPIVFHSLQTTTDELPAIVKDLDRIFNLDLSDEASYNQESHNHGGNNHDLTDGL